MNSADEMFQCAKEVVALLRERTNDNFNAAERTLRIARLLIETEIEPIAISSEDSQCTHEAISLPSALAEEVG
jgi:hypothetical protein